MFKSGEKNPFQLSKSVHAHTLKIIIRGREERGGQQGGGVRQTEEQRRRGGREESKWVFFFKVKKVIPRQEFKHQQKKACSSFKTSSRKRVPPLCTPVDSQEWLKFQEERVMSCRCIGEQDSHFTFRKEKKKKKGSKSPKEGGGGFPRSLLPLPLFLLSSFFLLSWIKKLSGTSKGTNWHAEEAL